MANDGAQPEILNKRALAIVSRVRDKLTGRDFPYETEGTLSIPRQVELLVQQATSHENLCQCYIGWSAALFSPSFFCLTEFLFCFLLILLLFLLVHHRISLGFLFGLPLSILSAASENWIVLVFTEFLFLPELIEFYLFIFTDFRSFSQTMYNRLLTSVTEFFGFST